MSRRSVVISDQRFFLTNLPYMYTVATKKKYHCCARKPGSVFSFWAMRAILKSSPTMTNSEAQRRREDGGGAKGECIAGGGALQNAVASLPTNVLSLSLSASVSSLPPAHSRPQPPPSLLMCTPSSLPRLFGATESKNCHSLRRSYSTLGTAYFVRREAENLI
mmetsp:Transcript_30513/g.72660  ORF Transcript_30513/g.72660 Transcript_30513/m.72660 type:complete len:163 (+) Transcript_30513:397-885(+)